MRLPCDYPARNANTGRKMDVLVDEPAFARRVAQGRMRDAAPPGESGWNANGCVLIDG